MASTAFKIPANPDAEFAFDKQSANFPYKSFLQLMRNAGLKKFLHKIKELHEKTEGPLDLESDDKDDTAEHKKSAENGEQLFDESTDDEEPVVTIRGIGKKRAQVLEDEEDKVPPILENEANDV